MADPLTGVTPFNILGTEPAKQSSLKTPFRPDVPCETQEPPDLRSEIGPGPASSASSRSAVAVPSDERSLVSRYAQILSQVGDARKLKAAGDLPAAKQLMDQAAQLYRGWVKDWTAFQRANGVKTTAPQPHAKGAKG